MRGRQTSRRLGKKIEMSFAHLKLDCLRLGRPDGPRHEFTLPVTAQNLRKMTKLMPMPKANQSFTNLAQEKIAERCRGIRPASR